MEAYLPLFQSLTYPSELQDMNYSNLVVNCTALMTLVCSLEYVQCSLYILLAPLFQSMISGPQDTNLVPSELNDMPLTGPVCPWRHIMVVQTSFILQS